MKSESQLPQHDGATTIRDRAVVGVRLQKAGEPEVLRSRAADVGLDVARLGGSALAFGLVRAGAPLALAIGAATAEGLPGAGRVHIGGLSPLTGGYTEGALGGDLAWALRAAGVDGLWIDGECEAAVLLIEVRGAGDVRARCVSAAPDWRRLGAGALARALVKLGAGAKWCGAVANGPGARRGVPYGLLVSGDAVSSATGRGGLGTLLAERGLWGIVVAVFEAAPAMASARSAARAENWLARAAAMSPRLKARARSGTLELFAAFAARGGEGNALRADWGQQARAAEVAHHGCKGCPTPCGMVFDRGGDQRGGARFGAAHALGDQLGLNGRFQDVLRLLEACDHEGVDAREAAAVLGLLARDPGGVPLGDVDALTAALSSLPPLGLLALAEARGCRDQVIVAGGQAARHESDLAANLGQVVSTAGNDPMRSFPFSVARTALPRAQAHAVGATDGSEAGESSAATALDETAWSPLDGVEPAVLDPHQATGKGRLVAWHEDLAAAIDIAGFCSFSAAGLLVDDALTLDELARLVAPDALAKADAPGAAWLAAGRELVLARRAFAAERRGPQALPAWASALRAPGLLDEYLAVRGEGARATELGLPDPALSMRPESGEPSATGLAVNTQSGAAVGVAARATLERQSSGHTASEQAATYMAAALRLRLHGALADCIGAFEIDWTPADCARYAPSTDELLCLSTLIDAMAARWPQASAQLRSTRGRLLPSVWRAQRLLGPEDTLSWGDELEFLFVIGGG